MLIYFGLWWQYKVTGTELLVWPEEVGCHICHLYMNTYKHIFKQWRRCLGNQTYRNSLVIATITYACTQKITVINVDDLTDKKEMVYLLNRIRRFHLRAFTSHAIDDHMPSIRVRWILDPWYSSWHFCCVNVLITKTNAMPVSSRGPGGFVSLISCK